MNNPRCRCEEEDLMVGKLHLPMHLHAGMAVSNLVLLESGCTRGRWVCPRLDRVRRRYSK